MDMADVVGTAELNVDGVIKGVEKYNRAMPALVKSTNEASAALSLMGRTEKDVAAGMNRTIGTLQKMATMSSAVSRASKATSDNFASEGAAVKRLAEVYGQLEQAKVKGTSEKKYAGQARTLEIQERMVTVALRLQQASQSAAATDLAAARAADVRAKATERLASAQAAANEKLARRNAEYTAGNRLSSTSTPASRGLITSEGDLAAARVRLKTAIDNQNTAEANLGRARKDAASTAAQLKAAEDAAALARTRMRTATTEAAQADQRLTDARHRLAQETQRAAFANAQAAAAQREMSDATMGSYFALYQIAAAYGAVGAAAAAAFTVPMNMATAFEKSFEQTARSAGLIATETNAALQSMDTTVSATAQAQLDGARDYLRSTIEDMSLEIPINFENLAEIGALGAQLGLSAEQLEAFTDTVGRYSAVTGVAAERAATDFGKIQNLLNIDTEEFDNLGSTIAELGVSAAATDPEILSMTLQIAGATTQFGIGTEATLGYATALSSLRVGPEAARGSLTRLFGAISKGSAEGAKGLEGYAKLMGITNEQALALQKSNPQAFFTQFVRGLAEARAAGQNLDVIYGNLKISQVRDQNLLNRLSGNYELLARSINTAYDAYARNTYLTDASNAIFETTAAKIQKMSNAWDVFMATLGEKSSSGLGFLADGLRNAFAWMTDMADKMPVLVTGFTTFVGVLALFAGYKAIFAVMTGGLVAYRNATASTLQGASVGWRSFTQIMRTGSAQQASASTAATNVIVQNAIRQQTANAATAAQLRLLTAAQREQALAAAAAAGTAARVGGGVGGFVKSMGGLVVISAAIAGIVALTDAFTAADRAAAEAAQKTAAAKAAYLDAAGGASAIAREIKADTQAYADLGGTFKQITTEAGQVTVATDKVGGAYRQLTTEIKDLGDGTAEVSKIWRDMDGNMLSEASSQVVNYADSVLNSTTLDSDVKRSEAEKRKQYGQTNELLQESTQIIGERTKALQKDAMTNLLFGEGGALSDPNTVAAFSAYGVNSAEQWTAAFQRGIEGKEMFPENTFETPFDERQFGMIRENIAAEKAAYEAEIAAAKAAANGNAQLEAENIRKVNEAWAERLAQLGQVEQGMKNLESAFGQSGSLFDQILAGEGLQGAMDMIFGAEDAAEGATEEFTELAAAGQDVVSTFNDIMGAAFNLQGSMAGVAAAAEDFGASLADNGTDFSVMTEAGRANLESLESYYDAFVANQAAMIEEGSITAQEAALNTQNFVTDLASQLSAMGVDTSQIDFLVDYVNSVVSTPVSWGIGADNSGAIKVINDTVLAAQRMQNYLMGVLGGPAGKLLGAASNIVSMAAPTFRPSSSTGNSTPIDLSKLVKQGNQNRSAENAEKAAGGGAKDAEKAAKGAEEAESKRLEYLKDTAKVYSEIASLAAKGIIDSGGIFDQLEGLGKSLAENGGDFNQATEAGRQNLAALVGVLDEYGASLSKGIESGAMSVEQAAAQFSQFAGGVRSELVALGVPMTQINSLFEGVGASSGGWDQAQAGIAGYSGAMKAAYNEAMMSWSGIAGSTDKVSQRTSALNRVLAATAEYYRGLTDNAFAYIDSEAEVFSSLDSLGKAIGEGGSSFSTMTEAGRENLSSLSSVVNAFGENLAVQVENGVLSAEDSFRQMEQFTSQLFSELVRSGVGAGELDQVWRALGLTKDMANGAGPAVRQFGGQVELAAKAAKSALGDVNKELDDYIKRLSDGFDALRQKMFGLSDAQDATASASNSLVKKYQDQLRAVQDLRAEQDRLNASMASQQVAYNNANREYLLSVKYGQSDRAADYLAQRESAGNDISATRSSLADNAKAQAETKAGIANLNGYTDAAIENRAALQDLQRQMLDQVVAYAKTGASQQEVERYAAQMRNEFVRVAQQSGYTSQQITKYTDVFDQYVQVVKSTPKTVTTTAVANTTAATTALNQIPRTGRYDISVPSPNTAAAVNALNALPKRGDYVVNTRADTSGAMGGLNSLPKSGSMVVTPTVNTGPFYSALSYLSQSAGSAGSAIGSLMGSNMQSSFSSFLSSIRSQISGVGSALSRFSDGGMVGNSGRRMVGFSNGGLVPGTPPANQKVDNLVVSGPGGPMGIQSGEFVTKGSVVRQPGVLPFLNHLNRGTLPASVMAMLAGGTLAGGVPGSTRGAGGGNGGGTGGVQQVALVPGQAAALANPKVVSAGKVAVQDINRAQSATNIRTTKNGGA